MHTQIWVACTDKSWLPVQTLSPSFTCAVSKQNRVANLNNIVTWARFPTLEPSGVIAIVNPSCNRNTLIFVPIISKKLEKLRVRLEYYAS